MRKFHLPGRLLIFARRNMNGQRLQVILLLVSILLFALFQPSISHGATTSGTLADNEVWSGTIALTGDVVVPANLDLIIEPGTRIIFPVRADDQVSGADVSRTELIVYGSLIANQTQGAAVTFTSGSTAPEAGDWLGIRFLNGSSGSLQNCVVEYADVGVYMYRNTSPLISGCTIRYNNKGLEAKYHSGGDRPRPVVNSCYIYDNTEYNFYASLHYSFYPWNTTVIDATNNWWGTADPREIAAGINDYDDNNGLAVVDYSSFLDGENGSPVAPSGGGAYLIGGTRADTTLSGTYLVPSYFRVQPGHELTIAPGTIIKFMSGAYLEVGSQATLTAGQAEGAKVVLTSVMSEPAFGDWLGIRFLDGSSGNLQNCVVEYADVGVYMHRDTSPLINGCTIRYNNKGLQAKYHSGGSRPRPVVNSCSIYDNAEYNFYASLQYSFYPWNTTVIDATNNWWGSADPLEIAASIYDYDDDSGMAVVDFSSFLDEEEGSPVAPAEGGTYLIGGTRESMTLSGTYLVPTYFKVQSGHELTVAPGTVIKFLPGAYLTVGSQGTLAAGQAGDDPVVFTSGMSEPAAGDWLGIRFSNGSSGSLQNCVVEYADVGVCMYRDTSPLISGCTIRYNNKGLEARHYYGSDLPRPVVNSCSIYDNATYNFYVSRDYWTWNTTVIDATNNWWGSADPQEIAAGIYDYNDNSGMAVVNFSFFLEEENGSPLDYVTDLQVECFDTRLIFTWERMPADYGGFFGYKVFFNNASEGISLPLDQKSYEVTGLIPATAYNFRVMAYDEAGNESPGLSIVGVTLLQNPANAAATPYSGHVEISWESSEPTDYVKYYSIYAADADFTTIEGMTPRMNVPGTSLKIAGLANDKAYYFAVTAVNISGGEQKEVKTVSATPRADTAGPKISNIAVNGELLTNGAVLNTPATITLDASDPAGVSHVEFNFDNSLLCSDTAGTDGYACFWNIVSEEDGSHSLTIIAYDTLGNSTTVDYGLNVALTPPASAPVIVDPASGTVINNQIIAVSGHAPKYADVVIYNNSLATGAAAPVDKSGNFSFPLSLGEGENRIQVQARNRAGTGPLSPEVLVTLDSKLPTSPADLTADPRAGGAIRLSWRRPHEAAVQGYHVYRAANSFSLREQGNRVNTGLLETTTFKDITPEDGTHYYRVAAVDAAGNESDLSPEAFSRSDSVLPRVLSISYTPEGPYDEATGRFGTGLVDVLLTVSEPIQPPAFLSITPHGGKPIPVGLTRISELQYTGFFVISETTPTGTAYAVFSGRDRVNNRGTEIDSGSALEIDTDGPAASRLTIQPAEPIRNDEADPVDITVTVGLDEPAAGGNAPVVSFLLSGNGRLPVAVDPLTEVNPDPGQAQAWQGTFALPADAGLAEVETLAFAYRGVDDLGNVSTAIGVPNRFQVYQGDLPPLEPPRNLNGQSLAGGKIRLTWKSVPDAAGYALFRKAPGETELTAYQELPAVFEYVDEPSGDGLYAYAVAAVRQDNAQKSASALSTPVEVTADSAAPGPPRNLALTLVESGIKADWDAPPYTEPVTYALYRADLPAIISVDGLTPVVTGVAAVTATDSNPSPADHAYVVTAVDRAGNESSPSNSYYLDFELLPVSSLRVLKIDDDPPVVSWTHPGGDIAGYDIYLGLDEQLVKLNSSPLHGQSFTDSGHAGSERHYTLIAVDTDNRSSPGRSIALPAMSAVLKEGTRIERNVMNRLEYLVSNDSVNPVDGVKLKAELGGRVHITKPFSVASGKSTTVPLTVGGYNDLADVVNLLTTIEISPRYGDRIEIAGTSQLEIGDGMLVADIVNEAFIRGGAGSVRFTLENTGREEIEIVTAIESGANASDEIILHLTDSDGNVLSRSSYKQHLGQNVITIPDGKTIARIPAGSVFTSQPLQIDIPDTSPNEVTLVLEISKIHHRLSQPEQVALNGLRTSRKILLAETAYWGDIISISPATSKGDKDILINGQAVDREVQLPLPGVPLDLVVANNGFERKFRVFTDDNGQFSHAFVPQEKASGIYRVSALHPGLKDRPNHGQFVITGVAVSPTNVKLNIPRNYEQTLLINVTAGEGTYARNLHLEYNETDQPGGRFIPGVNVSVNSMGIDLDSGQSQVLECKIWADNTAPATGRIILRVKSDDKDGNQWAAIVIDAMITNARPALVFTPDHLETRLALGDSVVEKIRLQNRGLTDLAGVLLSLVKPDGTAAPGWVHLNTPAAAGDIGVGEQRDVSLFFTPNSSSTNEGFYQYYLRVESLNAPLSEVPVYVAVTQSGIGNVLFKVSDIYTGTLDESTAAVVPGLSGAQIKVQNEQTLTETYTQNTDELGEALFSNLPAGRYKCRITAANHQEYIGRVWVKPGITGVKEVFLGYNLVTVEWEVVEATLEDKYEIVLKATYETNVPAPVVVVEPPSISLPEMEAGDVLHGEFTLTNYGLVRADNLKIGVPGDDAFFQYDILKEVPQNLDAKQRVTIPYRIVCIKPVDQADEVGSGGGGSGCGANVLIRYSFRCANGDDSGGSASFFISHHGACPGRLRIPGGWPPVEGSGSAGAVEIVGTMCQPEEKPCEEGNQCCESNEPSESLVSLMSGEYLDDVTDLLVGILGYDLAVTRHFHNNQWHFNHLSKNLEPVYGSINTSPKYINKERVRYEKENDQGTVYSYKNQKWIYIKENGFRWADKIGNWSEFDSTGRMLSYGNRNGVKVSLIYEDGENGRLVGISDNFDNQVLWYRYDGQNVSSVNDAAGRTVFYSYESDRLTKVSDVLGYETDYTYDQSGRLSSKVLPNGRIVTVTYNNSGYIQSVKDQDGIGKEFEYAYDAGKQEYYAIITGPGTKVIEKWFDEDGSLLREDINGATVSKTTRDGRIKIIEGAGGKITRRYYDEWENLTKIVYPDESTITYEYDPRLKVLKKQTNALGVVTTYEYDAKGNMTRMTEALGTDSERITEYTYDEYGNRVSIKLLGDANTEESETVMEYDLAGNVVSVSNPEGNTTVYTHDIMGNILTKTDAGQQKWQYEYDAAGRLIMQIDPLGNETQFVYDAVGNKSKEIDPAGNETGYTYDLQNNLTQITDAAGNSTIFDYNAAGKLDKRTDSEGKIKSYEYDSLGRMTKAVDGNGNEIAVEYDDIDSAGCLSCSGSGQISKVVYPTFTREFRYDRRDRKVKEIDILGQGEPHITAFEYDAAGNLTSETDAQNNSALYAYDSLNRLAKVRDALNQETEYYYDDRGNLIWLKDPKGQQTRFEYNNNNRVVKEIRPMGEETTYTYTKNGLLDSKTDPMNQKIEYYYDDARRLEEISYYGAGNSDTPAKAVIFTYDKNGNLLAYDDGTVSAVYVYGNLSQKISETVNYPDFSLTYTYDYYRNGLKKSYSDPDGITYEYAYDANNQLSRVSIPGEGSITVNEYAVSRPKTVTLPGGAKKEYSYDPLMRVATIQAQDQGENVFLDYRYFYDKAGNITAKETEHGRYDYVYDELYRLTASDNPAQDDETYSYDAVGNRLTTVGVAGKWSYNENNELQAYAGTNFEYDNNGNLNKKTDGGQVTNYIYNVENRLERVEDGSGSLIASYYYDPFGRRLWKEVDGDRTYFVYADEGLVGEVDAAGNVIRSYGYEPGSIWGTDPLFMKSGSQYHFYQNDHLGTPQKMTAANGAVVWSAKYSSFGEADIDLSSNITNNLRFSGQYFDHETKLHYNWRRYYSPTMGRYLTVDPIRLSDDLSSVYIYVGNNPLYFIDPKGLSSIAPGIFGFDPGREIDKFAYRLWNLFRKEAERQYCDHVSIAVGVCADIASISAVANTALSGGISTPATGVVYVTAQAVSVINGVATLWVCGPKLSSATSIFGPAFKGWWGAAVSALDAALSVSGN